MDLDDLLRLGPERLRAEIDSGRVDLTPAEWDRLREIVEARVASASSQALETAPLIQLEDTADDELHRAWLATLNAVERRVGPSGEGDDDFTPRFPDDLGDGELLADGTVYHPGEASRTGGKAPDAPTFPPNLEPVEPSLPPEPPEVGSSAGEPTDTFEDLGDRAREHLDDADASTWTDENRHDPGLSIPDMEVFQESERARDATVAQDAAVPASIAASTYDGLTPEERAEIDDTSPLGGCFATIRENGKRVAAAAAAAGVVAFGAAQLVSDDPAENVVAEGVTTTTAAPPTTTTTVPPTTTTTVSTTTTTAAVGAAPAADPSPVPASTAAPTTAAPATTTSTQPAPRAGSKSGSATFPCNGPAGYTGYPSITIDLPPGATATGYTASGSCGASFSHSHAGSQSGNAYTVTWTVTCNDASCGGSASFSATVSYTV